MFSVRVPWGSQAKNKCSSYVWHKTYPQNGNQIHYWSILNDTSIYLFDATVDKAVSKNKNSFSQQYGQDLVRFKLSFVYIVPNHSIHDTFHIEPVQTTF